MDPLVAVGWTGEFVSLSMLPVFGVVASNLAQLGLLAQASRTGAGLASLWSGGVAAVIDGE